VTAILTVAAVVLTPLGAWLVNKKWLGAPAFTLARYELSANTEIYVHPANRSANKRRKLGLSIGGIALSNIGDLVDEAGELRWRIDLRDNRIPQQIFFEKDRLEAQFFFDLDNMSNSVALFVSNEFRKEISKPAEAPSATANDVPSLLLNLRSYRSVWVRFERGILSDFADRAGGEYYYWADVHDGRELVVADIHHFSLASEITSAILTDPLYAWVLSFRRFSNLGLDNLELGHTSPGFCQGGALRLSAGGRAHIASC
jgi:hypothetical protein